MFVDERVCALCARFAGSLSTVLQCGVCCVVTTLVSALRPGWGHTLSPPSTIAHHLPPLWSPCLWSYLDLPAPPLSLVRGSPCSAPAPD